MSTYAESYCNTTTDLVAVEPGIDAYDQKRVIHGWTEISTKLWGSYNSGAVNRLFVNGEELADAQANQSAVNADQEWYYDAATDFLVLYLGTLVPDTTATIEAGQDWLTVKTEAVARASDFVRSYIGNKPILRRTGTGVQAESLRYYDDVIIEATAALACARLMRPYDRARAEDLERRYADRAEKQGILDMIRRGEIALWNETTPAAQGGLVRKVANDATTTGAPVDTRGRAWTTWDLIQIKIVTGGTFAAGTASTVTYSTWVGDSSGLKMLQAVTAEVIDGSYQHIGRGVYARFSPGVYVANDEWEVEVAGGEAEAGASVYSINLSRL